MFQGTFEPVPFLFVPLISCLAFRVPFCPEIVLFINPQPLLFPITSCFHLFFSLNHCKSFRRSQLTWEVLPMTHTLGYPSYHMVLQNTGILNTNIYAEFNL